MVKNLPASVGDSGDSGLLPGLGRYPGEGKGNPLQYPCLENLMDRGAWRATVHKVTKSQTQLKPLRLYLYSHIISPLSLSQIIYIYDLIDDWLFGGEVSDLHGSTQTQQLWHLG